MIEPRQTPDEAADALNEAALAIEGVDLNALHDDEVRAILGAKDAISAVTLRLRQQPAPGRGGDA